MTIEEDRAKYFWLSVNDPDSATEPEPATFNGSKITPLIDMAQYVDAFQMALAEVGKSASPAANAGDFIFIAGWWLGFNGGKVMIPTTPAELAGGPKIINRAPFSLDPTDVSKAHLRDILKEKKKRGVEVRVLGWASLSLLSHNPSAILPVPQNQALALSIQANANSFVNANAETIDAVEWLRDVPNPIDQAMLNVMAHSAGAAHMKCAIIGKKDGANVRAVGFTGGLDLEMARWADVGHEPVGTWDIAHEKPFWHDVQAMIEGPAVQGLYDHFSAAWLENSKHPVRTFVVDGTSTHHRTPAITAISSRTITAPLDAGATGLDHHVQSLRTVPAANYAANNKLPQGRQVSFAPNGLFEIRAAWRKAIGSAEKYIYMEDQAYWGHEIMSWVRERLRAVPDLRVILVAPGQGDPNDGDAAFGDLMFKALNEGLLGDGTASPLPPTARQRARFFRLWGEMEPDVEVEIAGVDDSDPGFDAFTLVTKAARDLEANTLRGRLHFFESLTENWEIVGNPATTKGAAIVIHVAKNPAKPTPGDKIFARRAWGITVHSKVTLIDDKWALIGSANIAQRSLYTDWEHAVSFLDPSSTEAVKEFRKALWNEHFNNPGVQEFDDIDVAITAWDPFDPDWRIVPLPQLTPEPPQRPAGNFAPPFIQPVPLPFPAPPPPLTIPPNAQRQFEIDKFIDVDSRNVWGGALVP